MRRARPVARAIHRAQASATRGGTVDVLPGDPAATERLRALLGAPTVRPGASTGMRVHAAVPGADTKAAAEALAAHRLRRGKALAILVGTHAERAAMEEVFLATELELSNIAHVASLHGPGGRRALDAVAVALDDEAIAGGRRYHELRHPVARLLVGRASRRAGMVGSVNLFPGADYSTLALLHVQLMAELSALYERRIGAEQLGEAAAVAGAGFGWRALARVGARALPAPASLLRGGIAYASTRALGEAAVARLEAGGDLVGATPARLMRERLDPLAARLGIGE